jgi:tetratricopeptide (TPR) repeat protein
MEQAHHHPLNASSICCPEHVFELISIYTQQNREDETLSILLFFSENMETHFLLDNSESSQDLKQKLGRFYNKFALKKTLNPLTMHQLLDTSFNLLSSLPDSTDNLGYLATATSNLAFIAKEEGDLEKAVKLLDKALSIDKKLEDGAGEIITRINKAAVLNEMAAFREAFFTVKDCFAKLDKKVTEYIRSVSEKELKNSKKFKETLQLFLVASVNLLKALENIDDTSLISEARSKKQKSYDLSLKYLGESHQLTNFFCEPLRSDRTFSSFGSNLDLSFHQSSKDYSNTSQQSEKKKPEKRVSEKTPLFSQSSFSSKDPRPTPKRSKSSQSTSKIRKKRLFQSS